MHTLLGSNSGFHATGLKQRRTKIVATLGPATASPEAILRLVGQGVDVFRLNFSHGSHAQHAEAVSHVRNAAARAGRHVAVLADLCGPKIRVGRFPNGSIPLVAGTTVTVTTREVEGAEGLIPSEYDHLHSDVTVGSRLLLDDGNLELEVEQLAGQDLTCRVLRGGTLSNRKGMNLPGVTLSTPALTEKDRADATFAVGLGVDLLALSFVRSPKDVMDLRDLLDALGREVPIVAKIEKPEALRVIGYVLQVADGIMVARGDLGVEVPAEEVPVIQQELVRLCVAAGKPVIVATQMLESMIHASRPTRAEVTDVAWAAMGGTDAVMLSGETASGAYPFAAVETMDRVLRRVEAHQWSHGQFAGLVHHVLSAAQELRDEDAARSEAVSRAIAHLSRELQVRAIVVPTLYGRMARLVSSERPAAPIVALSALASTCQSLALLWGVTPVLEPAETLRDPELRARAVVLEMGLADAGQNVLLVYDASAARDGSRPTVSVLRV